MTTHLCEWCENQPAPHGAFCKKCTRTFRCGLVNFGAYFLDIATVTQRATRLSDRGATMGGPSKTISLIVDMRFLERDDAVEIDEDGHEHALGRGTAIRDEAIATIDRWSTLVETTWPQLDWREPVIGPACADVDCTHPSCWRPPCATICRHDTCTAWKRRRHPSRVSTDRGLTYRAPVASQVAYLIRMTGQIITMPWAGELMADVLDLETRLRRLIDRPAERWYAGVCGAVTIPDQPHDGTTCACACHNAAPGLIACDIPGGCGLEFASTEPVVCEQPLHVDPTSASPWVKCPTCGATHDVADRRTELLTEAEDRLATTELIVRVITTLGDRDVSMSKISARIRTWAARERIKARGTRVIDGRDRPIYRIGDVLELLAQDQREKTDRKAKEKKTA